LAQAGIDNQPEPVLAEPDSMPPPKPEGSTQQALPPEILKDQSADPIQESEPSQITESLQDLLPIATPTPDEADDTDTSPSLVLAIDKDPQVVDLYKRYLADHPYTVETLTELEQAVTVARSIQPFAITLDIAMQSTSESESGELDGWQVLKALKADPYTKNIPVIVCTIVTEQERAFRLGAADYLLKPILEGELAQAIGRLKA
jgi:CheY-like chemotaxis protein